MRPIFCAIASCLPTACPHCTRSAAQRREISRQRFAAGDRGRGQGQAAGVEGDERQLEPLALAPEDVLHRHFHVGEADDAVFDRLESHEVEPLHHLHARANSVSTMNAVIFFVPGPRHHHHQLGDRPVGAPQLLAVEDVVRAVGREDRRTC